MLRIYQRFYTLVYVALHVHLIVIKCINRKSLFYDFFSEFCELMYVWSTGAVGLDFNKSINQNATGENTQLYNRGHKKVSTLFQFHFSQYTILCSQMNGLMFTVFNKPVIKIRIINTNLKNAFISRSMEHNPTPITLICLDMILISQIKASHWPTCVHQVLHCYLGYVIAIKFPFMSLNTTTAYQ